MEKRWIYTINSVIERREIVINVKKYMKVGILIMAISMSMAGLTGCKMARDNIGNKIEDNLKAELGEEFNVFRLQGSNFDTEYQAYVSPASNPEIRFSVNADKNGKLKDFQKSSYYSAKVWNDLAQEIIKGFDEYEIEAFCKASAGKVTTKAASLDTTVNDYIEMNPDCQFGVDVILNESDAKNKEILSKIVSVLEKQNEIYPGICIYGKFYFYEEEWYLKTKEFMKSTVHPSSTVLEQNNLKYSLLNGIKDNKVNESVEEMIKNLEENNAAK